MCRWVRELAGLTTPLLRLIKQRVLLSHVIAADETTVRCQNKKSKSYFWSFCGDGDHPYIVYDFRPNRSSAGPIEWFSDDAGDPLFTGHVQCDAYSGYDALWRAPFKMTWVACWAHARRKFDECIGSDGARARHALELIKTLYKIEKDAREQELSAPARQLLRQRKATPLVDAFFAWCKAQRAQRLVLPKSRISQAMGYATNQESGLRRYLDDGLLEIDNNLCERSLRGIALGRKNWLFVGSEAGGQAAAAMLSLISSCQRSGVNEWAYLKDVFTRLPTAASKSGLGQFLPDVWASERPEHVLHHPDHRQWRPLIASGRRG